MLANAVLLRYNATENNGTLGGVACMLGLQPLDQSKFDFTPDQKLNISKTQFWAYNGEIDT